MLKFKGGIYYMTLLEELNSRSRNGNMSSKLLILAQEVTEMVADHLKLINEQLPEFDIHDTSHSKKVIENMEGLMKPEVIKRLSGYEIFRITSYNVCYTKLLRFSRHLCGAIE